MGCDIHMYLENKKGSKHLWSAVSGLKLDMVLRRNFKSIDGYYSHIQNPKKAAKLVKEHRSWARKYFYHDRNYSLFAMLSNVRNDGSVESLCEEGNCDGVMPDDASDKVFCEYRHWGRDAHSLTVFTLQELLIDNKDFWEKDTTDWNGKPCKYKDLCEDFLRDINAVASHAQWKNLDKWRIVAWYDN